MNRRTQSRSSGLLAASSAALVVLLILTQLPLASGPRGYLKGALAPLSIATAAAVDWAAGGLSVVGEAAGLRSRNQALAAQNATLRRQLVEVQAQGQENTELRRALEFKRTFGHALLAATVIGRAPDGLTRSLTIGKGRADGLEVGMVVVSGAGLVGRLSEVGERTATVRTLVDAQSRVNGYTSKSGLEGTVIGEGGPLAMEVLPRPGSLVTPGEWVLTSGIGGLYPRGILVGQVAQFHRRDSATIERADLAPAVDFRSAAILLVVTDFRGVGP